ncbi:MAG: xanthine phosphoribosyltransferase [Thermotogaceae bacterium]|nr:xanthine phosphoribosyltransferase [Thermotogaceae bacterium]
MAEKIELKNILEKLQERAEYLGNGIVKVDFFLNHLVDTSAMDTIGEEIANFFKDYSPNKILTVESSGIIPAFATALKFRIPLLFAKKKGALTMKDALVEKAESRTRGSEVELHVSKEFLNEDDKVIIVDDFLASGKTIEALMKIVKRSGADLVGIAAVMEKEFEEGRKHLEKLTDVPIYTVFKISLEGDKPVFKI